MDNAVGKENKKRADVPVGKNIKKARIDAGLTQKELAEKVNLTYNYISQIENDRLPPTNTLFMIADALNVSPAKLFEEDPLRNDTELSKTLANLERHITQIRKGLD